MKKFLPIALCFAIAITADSTLSGSVGTSSHDEIKVEKSNGAGGDFGKTITIHPYHGYDVYQLAEFSVQEFPQVAESKYFYVPVSIGKADTKRHCTWLADVIKLC